MAKYVGKVFSVPNNKLGLRRSGTHYVHVKWYNPFKKLFFCRIMTSLEEKKKLGDLTNDDKEKRIIRMRNGNFHVFEEQKYDRLRNGDITPIPVGKVEGSDVWSGYENSVYLRRSVLSPKSRRTNIRIKK